MCPPRRSICTCTGPYRVSAGAPLTVIVGGGFGRGDRVGEGAATVARGAAVRACRDGVGRACDVGVGLGVAAARGGVEVVTSGAGTGSTRPAELVPPTTPAGWTPRATSETCRLARHDSPTTTMLSPDITRTTDALIADDPGCSPREPLHVQLLGRQSGPRDR